SLAYLVWLALLMLAVAVILAVVKWSKDWHDGKPADPSGSPVIAPLLLLNVVLIVALMYLANAGKFNFRYPLLRLYRLLFGLITGRRMRCRFQYVGLLLVAAGSLLPAQTVTPGFTFPNVQPGQDAAMTGSGLDAVTGVNLQQAGKAPTSAPI